MVDDQLVEAGRKCSTKRSRQYQSAYRLISCPGYCRNGFVAFIILIIGYSIVRHGILIERPLARRGFFEQWRGIVIVATTVAIFIALLVALTHSNLGGMLLITSLATSAYALFTWSSYTAHDRYIAMLGPFLHSTNMRHWLKTDLAKDRARIWKTSFSTFARMY